MKGTIEGGHLFVLWPPEIFVLGYLVNSTTPSLYSRRVIPSKFVFFLPPANEVWAKDNIFTPVCHSVHRVPGPGGLMLGCVPGPGGGGAWSGGSGTGGEGLVGGVWYRRRGPGGDPPGMATAVGGTTASYWNAFLFIILFQTVIHLQEQIT